MGSNELTLHYSFSAHQAGDRAGGDRDLAVAWFELAFDGATENATRVPRASGEAALFLPFGSQLELMNTLSHPMLSFTVWKTRWPLLREGEAMSGLKRRKGRNGSFGLYYADIFYKGKRYRKSLRTTVKDEALKRFVEYYLSVERGDSKQGEIKFEEVKYEPSSYERKWMYENHLLPAFKGQMLGTMDIQPWLQDFANKWSAVTVKTAIRVLREMGFDPPKVKYKYPGKVFDDTQILTEDQVLDVIHNYVRKRYRPICLVAAYSMLRRGDLLNLKKRNVDFKNGWISVLMGKTGKSVRIPISKKLKAAFGMIKVVPMKPGLT